MFDNSFANQHIFHYYELYANDNEETLDPKMTINIDNNVDNEVEDNVNNKIIPCVLESGDAFGFTFLFIIIGHLVVNVSRKL